MIRDALGRALSLEHLPRRVVSLVPSLTETLFALGAGDTVAGITDYCIFPPDLDLPRLGGTKNPRVAAVRELGPDLVHMNLEENLQRHADEIGKFAPLFVSEPKTVRDVAGLITTLGQIHQRQDQAAAMLLELHAALAVAATNAFTFACPIWKDPWMWCGGDTYVSSLVEAAGGRNVLAGRTRYPTVSPEDVTALDPDILFLPDEPYAFTGKQARELEQMMGCRVVGPFPGHLFTWHGSRTILGLRFLAETLRGAV